MPSNQTLIVLFARSLMASRIAIYCLYTVKGFHAFQSNINSSICTQFNGFKYCFVTLIIQSNTSHLLTRLNG